MSQITERGKERKTPGGRKKKKEGKWERHKGMRERERDHRSLSLTQITIRVCKEIGWEKERKGERRRKTENGNERMRENERKSEGGNLAVGKKKKRLR